MLNKWLTESIEFLVAIAFSSGHLWSCERFYSSEHSAIGNDNRLTCCSGLGANFLHSWKNIKAAFSNLSKDDVLAIEMWEVSEAKEELGAVCSWSSVGHGKDSLSRVLVLEVLIWEVRSVDGLTTSSISSSEISSLGHELWNDSMELASLEVKWLSKSSNSLLSCAKSSEVLRSIWSISVEVNLNTSCRLSTDSNVKENWWHLFFLSNEV